jgi:Zn-dependent protease
MFPNMVEETPYDLRWRMFGIPVRVHPLFWLVAAVLSWPLLDLGIPHLLIGIACIFVSILVHELGHVVVGRAFGSHGHIVLWAFGGVAPGSNELGERWKRVLVLFAGPGAQFILYGLVWLGWRHVARQVTNESLLDLLYAAAFSLLYINLVWPIVNLMPLWPLDGGQITREFFTWITPRNGVRFSLQVSIGFAVLLAVHALLAWRTGNGIPYLEHYANRPVHAIFFGLFAVMGIQALQMEMAHRRSFDPWDYHERW